MKLCRICNTVSGTWCHSINGSVVVTFICTCGYIGTWPEGAPQGDEARLVHKVPSLHNAEVALSSMDPGKITLAFSPPPHGYLIFKSTQASCHITRVHLHKSSISKPHPTASLSQPGLLHKAKQTPGGNHFLIWVSKRR